MITKHDIPGAHVALVGYGPFSADGVARYMPVFKAPFKCKIRSIKAIALGANWEGAASTTNYYNMITYDHGASGTAAVGLGTVVGSVTATLFTAGIPYDLFAPAATAYRALASGGMLEVRMTVGAGTPASGNRPPCLMFETVYEGA